MTQEQLTRGKEIETTISVLKANVANVKKITTRDGKFDKSAKLTISDCNYNETPILRFIPLTFETFIDVYIKTVETEISNLQKELASL